MSISLNIGDLRTADQPLARKAGDGRTPLRIVVLGPFRGQDGGSGESPQPLASPLRPIPVGLDNVNGLPGRLGAQCDVDLGEKDQQFLTLRFASLDDFHPDRLFEKIPLFARFKQLRRQLLSHTTFDRAAQEVRSWGLYTKAAPEKEPPPHSGPRPAATPAAPAGGNLLDQIIGATSSLPARQQIEPTDDIAQIIRNTVAPYRLPKAAPDQADLVACVDAAAGQLMHKVLRAPAFQRLEAAWRGLEFLVRRLLAGTNAKIFLLDLGLDELKADLGQATSLESAALYKTIVDQTVGTPGAEPWGLMIADYQFGATSIDALLAGCLAKIASRAGSPLLAGASSQLVGCESLAATPDPQDWTWKIPEKTVQAWDSVRCQAEASSLGLVLPRFLLRMPYGPESSPVEAFPFTEIPDPMDHEAYLWGNGAVAAALLLAQAAQRRPSGGMAEPLILGDLPSYGYEQDGEYQLKPCAEALLTHRAAEKIMAAGLIALMAIKGSNSVGIPGWQSVAK